MGSFAGLILLAVVLLLFLLFFTRLRRQQRAFAADQRSFDVVQESLRPGQSVMTTSGLHGTVVSAPDDDVVVLEIAPGVHTRWARLAVAEIVDPGPELPDDPDPPVRGRIDLPAADTPASDPPEQNLNETTAR